jgi:hypothetical protein
MTFLASSAAALVGQANTWQSRANQAWGSSRVWNSGSSFETDLSSMTSDRNTWQSRANNAWGPSRVWNSGSSFETLYNSAGAAPRSLSYGTATGLAGSTLSGLTSNGGLTFFDGSGRVSIPKTGYYQISAYGRWSAQNAGQSVSLTMSHLNSGGTDIGWAGLAGTTSASSVANNGNNGDGSHFDQGVHVLGFFNAGELVRLTEGHSWGVVSSFTLVVTFIPTPSYPQ